MDTPTTDLENVEPGTTEKPKLRPANENPWYLLATLYGEPHKLDEESDESEFKQQLINKNRAAWNRWYIQSLGDSDRQALRKKGYTPDNFVPLTENDIQNFTRAYRSRSNSSDASLPDPLEGALFDQTLFEGTVFFSGYCFPYGALFEFATFKGDAYFDYASFNRLDNQSAPSINTWDAEFSSATFNGLVTFRKTSFGSVANFNSVTFCKQVFFTQSTFKDEASFISTTFIGGANFNSVIFKENVILNTTKSKKPPTTFHDVVHFHGATFHQKVQFFNVIFKDDAFFVKTTFEKAAFFNSSEFQGSVFFKSAIFNNDARFISTNFLETTNFHETQFNLKTIFVNADFKSHTTFTCTIFKCNVPDFRGSTLHEATEWHGAQWPLVLSDREATQNQIYAYERLKLEMERLKKHEDEQFFFRKELRARRELMPPRSFGRLSNLAYDWFADYGHSEILPLIWLMEIFLFSTLIFASIPNIYDKNIPWWDAANLSIKSLIPILPNSKTFEANREALTIIGQLIEMLNAIAGPVLLFLVGLALRNRFRMK